MKQQQQWMYSQVIVDVVRQMVALLQLQRIHASSSSFNTFEQMLLINTFSGTGSVIVGVKKLTLI